MFVSEISSHTVARAKYSAWVQSSEVAKSLAFHQDVRTRCITLQGDDFNPSGTLTGASSRSV